MTFSLMCSYVVRTLEFQNIATMNGVDRMYSDMVPKEVSHSYWLEWSMAKLENVCRGVGAFKHKVVTIFCLFAHLHYVRLFCTIQNQVIKKVSWFGGISVVDASLYEPCNSSIRTA